jgi:hypothetical protein
MRLFSCFRGLASASSLALLAAFTGCDDGSAGSEVRESRGTAEASRDGGTPSDGPGSPASPSTTGDGGPRNPAVDDPSGPAAVQFIGRFDERDPAGPACAWPGCRIIARFEGTSVSVRLSETDETWMEGAPSEWDVAIDGGWQPKLVMTPNTSTSYVLASNLPPGVHVVELYKRSETQNGVTQFRGFDFGGEGKLLAPPPRKTRRIEVIGDSAAAAFGVEGVGLGPDCPGPDWAARWQNFRRSFGARLGEALDADVAGTVYSGKGIAKNIWHADKETMPLIFARSNPNDPRSTWDFGAFPVDVVVVMMGGNDFAIGQPVDEGPATLSDFTETYDRFVVDLRSHYPAAQILLVTSPSVSDLMPEGRSSRSNVVAGIAEVVRRRISAADARVHRIAPRLAEPAELTGCNGHGTPELHQRIADELATTIRPLTGW